MRRFSNCNCLGIKYKTLQLERALKVTELTYANCCIVLSQFMMMKLFSCRLESGTKEWSSDIYRDHFVQCYSQLHRHRGFYPMKSTATYCLCRSIHSLLNCIIIDVNIWVGAAVSVGGHFICPQRFHNSRLLYWETTDDGTVCLTEECLVGQQLLNRSVLLRLGGGVILLQNCTTAASTSG